MWYKNKLIIRIHEKDDDGDIVDGVYAKIHINIEYAKRKFARHEQLNRLEKYILVLTMTNKKDLIKVAKGDEILEVTVEDMIRFGQDPKL